MIKPKRCLQQDSIAGSQQDRSQKRCRKTYGCDEQKPIQALPPLSSFDRVHNEKRQGKGQDARTGRKQGSKTRRPPNVGSEG